ncbi:centriole, cilia and spindle-associated protein isoform X2 [Mugil cephalus]|uniref:centriole, cilia and spindle-associated protein isoform X2 n=1 Tax=Mugil cephalus TaxID=48193 RepID=UPI001FB6786C|nr:centriole, cilia and spindle-associated protein isoform X2 [Mugil cephalus]
MVTKKVRTEYMKKFRDPRWETFSKCYEDSLKYRLTRRVMEHSHKPWFWEGWDSGSDSSGWSTPRVTRNKVVPLSLPPPPPKPSEVKQRLWELKTRPGARPPSEDGEAAVGGPGEAPAVETDPTTAVVENGVNEADGGSATAAPNASAPSDDTTTDNGPADTASSDGEPTNPPPRPRHRRRRAPRSEPGNHDASQGEKPAVARKPPRAKSQPAISTKEKENRRPSSRLDWTETQGDVRRTTNETLTTSDACVQTRRESDRRGSRPDRRRARSADLEKTRRSQLAVVDDRWMTEYMRCFSARLR